MRFIWSYHIYKANLLIKLRVI
uniref:Uncharacterized protein n=1 Tax=Rhizophora mucronata TaxID=61149 RepID=A0A2P2PEG7_RHIMU